MRRSIIDFAIRLANLGPEEDFELDEKVDGGLSLWQVNAESHTELISTERRL